MTGAPMLSNEERALAGVAEREKEVHEWQLFYGMVPRADSQLTRLFALGRVSMRADEVARELFATSYIYDKSLYGDLIEDYMRHVAKLVRDRYPEVSWTKTWEIVRFFGPPSLKLSLCRTCELRIPDLRRGRA